METAVTFERVANPPGVDTIRSLAERIWPPTFAPILPPDQIPYMMRMMYAPGVILAELTSGVRWELVLVSGVPSGYLSWGPCEDRPSTAALHKVYLLPALHGRGIGQTMLDRAAACCREEGHSAVLLAVNKRNERAIRAYLRNGFRVADARVKDIGGGFVMDDWLMLKDLP
jgi:GNAT superfamily N-acetyltransferase